MANLTLVFSCNNRYTLSCKITVQKPTNTNTDNPSRIAATPSPQPSASASATASAATDSPIPTATTSVTTNSPNPTATTSVATNVPVPVSTPVQTPSASAVPATSNLTLSSETALSSASVDGKPTYNADGSVTFTVTQQYGGGGLVFALDTSKTAQDLSDYSKVSFRVSADAEAPVVFRAFTSDVFWNGFTEIGSTTTSKDKKEIICDIPYGDKLCGFGVKYNTWGYDTSTIPQKLTITIHAISLVRDSRDITDATTNYFDETASKKNYKDETSMPGINFTKADLIMDYAKENDIKVRGHVLVWDADMCDWFFRIGYDTSKGYASADIIKTRLKDYIRQVITHFEEKYPGIIYCWDVVNEAVGDDPAMDSSSYGYRMNGPFCGLFNENFGVKPAFVSIHDLMKKTH